MPGSPIGPTASPEPALRPASISTAHDGQCPEATQPSASPKDDTGPSRRVSAAPRVWTPCTVQGSEIASSLNPRKVSESMEHSTGGTNQPVDGLALWEEGGEGPGADLAVIRLGVTDE